MKRRVHYTTEQLHQFIIDDLENDARCAEEQAVAGPFYPNVTPESLRSYAIKCRSDIATMKAGAGKLDRYGWPLALKA
jgi:hypothetical protein